ncbi:MAG: tRNA (adenosine(37)-N6)-dimethylallyltransferase MiaA [Bacteroidales bacterium]|jgi:tRNA dimethylallyltransferase|nr:tRNA (adenosine(37)-N6)-dimethylallyltransferase MiaA [Bacteroidales bacterium]
MRRVVILLGPTAVGKTDYSIELAHYFGSPVISCDSRQIFRQMSIGTAVPSPEQLSRVKHYFIHSHSVEQYYTAGKYEIEALALVEELFRSHETLVMTGGSGLYIDAFCKGLDAFPKVDQELRKSLTVRLAAEGLESLQMELKKLDSESYNSIDISNGQRVIRALEVTIGTGRKFSSFKTGRVRKRNFEIVKIGLTRPREVLYDRIDRRVDMMMEAGLVDEVRSLVQYRDMPALKTVGYKEIFDYLDGNSSLKEAVRLVKRNSRHYAKRQLTYWGRDNEIKWLEIGNQLPSSETNLILTSLTSSSV